MAAESMRHLLVQIGTASEQQDMEKVPVYILMHSLFMLYTVFYNVFYLLILYSYRLLPTNT